MITDLPKDDSEDKKYIQFRGYQSSVVVPELGLSFKVEKQETPDGERNVYEHVPKEIITREEYDNNEYDDRHAVVLDSLAEELVEGESPCNLLSYGVACEYPDDEAGTVCGEVFGTPKARNTHMQVHYDNDDGGTTTIATDTETSEDSE